MEDVSRRNVLHLIKLEYLHNSFKIKETNQFHRKVIFPVWARIRKVNVGEIEAISSLSYSTTSILIFAAKTALFDHLSVAFFKLHKGFSKLYSSLKGF